MTHDPFDNKVVMVIGGTGTWGQRFIDILLHEYNPSQIRIFSRGELLQQETRGKFKNDQRLRFIIGDVRDDKALHRAMYGVNILANAAALKQIGACELNPIEAIQTNIYGAINVVTTAINSGVEKVMGISSDKACMPSTLYGATKMVMEKVIIQANVFVGTRRTRLSCVRYGNVVGSRGSVVPIFQEQKKGGTITLTDARMTRFWLTIEQATRFSISCMEIMKGGEIFVPIIPSIKVLDLADALAPECKRVFTGIRPSEKLHEVLLSEEEARHTRKYNAYFLIEPEQSFRDSDKWEGGQVLPDGFKYTSDNNDWWLTQEELKEMIKQT